MYICYDIIIIMKYTDCPQCNNKIIDRTPLKCVYCGYDSTKEDVNQKLELLDPPARPSRENTTIIQAITLILALVSALAFLISFLYTNGTVVDNVIVENDHNLSTFRIVTGIIFMLTTVTFFSSSRNFEKEMLDYTNDIRMIYDINERIEHGARLDEFDELEQSLIIQNQANRQTDKLNQKTSKYIYYK